MFLRQKRISCLWNTVIFTTTVNPTVKYIPSQQELINTCANVKVSGCTLLFPLTNCLLTIVDITDDKYHVPIANVICSLDLIICTLLLYKGTCSVIVVLEGHRCTSCWHPSRLARECHQIQHQPFSFPKFTLEMIISKEPWGVIIVVMELNPREYRRNINNALESLHGREMWRDEDTLNIGTVFAWLIGNNEGRPIFTLLLYFIVMTHRTKKFAWRFEKQYLSFWWFL